MAANPFSARRVPGLRESSRRAIAFLNSSQDSAIDAEAAFNALAEKHAMEVRSRFDYWTDGGKEDKYFHGWPNDPSYKHCFVFKWKENRVNHRLYGFLCNPKEDDPSFQVCVLVSHREKKEWETDKRELDRANMLRTDARALAAIRRLFPKVNKETKWLN